MLPEPSRLAGRIVDGVYYPPIETRDILWEVPGAGGRFRRLWDTWKFVIAQPSFFFATMRADTGLGRAVGFAAIFVAVGQAAGMVHGSMLGEGLLGWLEDFWFSQGMPMGDFEDVKAQMRLVFASQLMSLPLTIVSALLVLFAHAFAYWLAAWAVGGASFPALLKVTCYAQATHLFSLIPFLGCACVQPFYYMLLCFLGFRYAAGLSLGRSLLVVFAPLLGTFFACGGLLFNALLVEVILHLVFGAA